MNKKGANTFVPLLVIGLIIFLMFALDYALEDFSFIPETTDLINFGNQVQGFESVFGNDIFTPLNYVFGKVPDILSETTGEAKSAGLVIIALWTIMFLIFADIMNIFGPFSKPVNWAVAVLFAIIGANIKLISYVSVYFLVIFSTFGSFAILLSLFVPIILFILFHFGGMEIRKWVVNRRAQDAAIRAVAGGKEVAGVVEGLGEIGKGLEKVSKK